MNDDTFWMIKSNEIFNENMSVGYTHDDNTFHNFYSNTDEFQFNEVSNQQSSQDYGVYQKSSQRTHSDLQDNPARSERNRTAQDAERK